MSGERCFGAHRRGVWRRGNLQLCCRCGPPLVRRAFERPSVEGRRSSGGAALVGQWSGDREIAAALQPPVEGVYRISETPAADGLMANRLHDVHLIPLPDGGGMNPNYCVPVLLAYQERRTRSA